MLIDTNGWSELLRPQPNLAVTQFLRENRDELILSTVVAAEMEFGIARLADSRRRRQLREFVDDLYLQFADRLLAPDLAVANLFGATKAKLQAAGTPIPDMDLLIASQATACGVPLVTRNIADMERTGATIINPWTP